MTSEQQKSKAPEPDCQPGAGPRAPSRAASPPAAGDRAEATPADVLSTLGEDVLGATQLDRAIHFMNSLRGGGARERRLVELTRDWMMEAKEGADGKDRNTLAMVLGAKFHRYLKHHADGPVGQARAVAKSAQRQQQLVAAAEQQMRSATRILALAAAGDSPSRLPAEDHLRLEAAHMREEAAHLRGENLQLQREVVHLRNGLAFAHQECEAVRADCVSMRAELQAARVAAANMRTVAENYQLEVARLTARLAYAERAAVAGGFGMMAGCVAQATPAGQTAQAAQAAPAAPAAQAAEPAESAAPTVASEAPTDGGAPAGARAARGPRGAKRA